MSVSANLKKSDSNRRTPWRKSAASDRQSTRRLGRSAELRNSSWPISRHSSSDNSSDIRESGRRFQIRNSKISPSWWTPSHAGKKARKLSMIDCITMLRYSFRTSCSSRESRSWWLSSDPDLKSTMRRPLSVSKKVKWWTLNLMKTAMSCFHLENLLFSLNPPAIIVRAHPSVKDFTIWLHRELRNLTRELRNLSKMSRPRCRKRNRRIKIRLPISTRARSFAENLLRSWETWNYKRMSGTKLKWYLSSKQARCLQH